MAKGVNRGPGSRRERPQACRLRSLLARDVRGGGRVVCVVARTGGWRGVGYVLDGRSDDDIDVQRPWKASAVGSGGGREKGHEGECN